MEDYLKIGQALKSRVEMYNAKPDVYSSGHVKAAYDGIVRVEGVPDARYGELLQMENDIFAIAMNLEEEEIGAVLLNGEQRVYAGMTVRGTGRVVEVPVGEALLGRVVSPIGLPMDDKGPIRTSHLRPIEAPAPSIIDRKPVTRPLETGILAIDSMVPIGRGQRELIIGDRQVGKTAIAISTILNQRDKGVLCVYVAIGQKASTIAQLVNQLTEQGAMDYTVVVASSASDSAPMQYIAPYAGCAIAEEFMYSGRDVLVVYDDLSKHAVAYRAMSLLLRRPPGREAFPGDVFYLHSRLLERAAQLSDEKGGGSMSALPLIETMAGDISAYIPTNVISITDGQIYLESELFHAGQRPALNVGLSVSRVGGAAQAKAMRSVAGTMRLEMAQYRELAVFSQFGSDLDSGTRDRLTHGQRMTEAFKQDQFTLFQLPDQVIILHIISSRLLSRLQQKQVWPYLHELLNQIHALKAEMITRILKTGKITDEDKASIDACAAEQLSKFLAATERA